MIAYIFLLTIYFLVMCLVLYTQNFTNFIGATTAEYIPATHIQRQTLYRQRLHIHITPHKFVYIYFKKFAHAKTQQPDFYSFSACFNNAHTSQRFWLRARTQCNDPAYRPPLYHTIIITPALLLLTGRLSSIL